MDKEKIKKIARDEDQFKGLINQLKKFSFGLIWLSVLVMPLLVLPFTAEYYEFNKSVFFSVVVLLLVLLLGVQVAFSGKFTVLRSDFDLWLVFIGLGSFVSLLLGKHFLTGLLGYSGRLSEGVLVILGLIFFTFVLRQVVTGPDQIRGIFIAIMLSGALVGIITILQFFGIYLFQDLNGFGFTRSRNFSTLGSNQVLPFYFLILVPLSLSYLIGSARRTAKALLALPLVVLIFGGFIFAAGNFWTWPGIILWILFIVSIIFVFLQSSSIVKSSFIWLGIVLIFGVIFFMGRNIDGFANRFTEDAYTKQPVLKYDTAWQIAVGSISDSPLRGFAGSGPDTFAYSFAKHRPADYNSSSNKGVRFSRSANQLFEIIGNYGILGLIVWGGCGGMASYYVFKLLGENHSYPHNIYISGLGAAIWLAVVSSLFTYFTISLWLVIAVILGLIVVVRSVSVPRLSEKINLGLSVSKEKIAVEEQNMIPYLTIFPVLIFVLFNFYWIQKIYRAEVMYKNSIDTAASLDLEIEKNNFEGNNEDENQDLENDTDQQMRELNQLFLSYEQAGMATNLFKYKSGYHRRRAVVSIDILKKIAALQESNQGDYSNEQANILQTALEGSEEAVTLNSVDVRNWETRYWVYRNLDLLTNKKYGQQMFNMLEEALKRDPVKPELYHQKGIILSLSGHNQSSLDQLRQAVSLQPLYLEGKYDLAMQYKKMGMFSSAKQELNEMLKILENADLQSTQAYDQIQKDLQNIDSLANEENMENIESDSHTDEISGNSTEEENESGNNMEDETNDEENDESTGDVESTMDAEEGSSESSGSGAEDADDADGTGQG
jgi:hypothetical protein